MEMRDISPDGPEMTTGHWVVISLLLIVGTPLILYVALSYSPPHHWEIGWLGIFLSFTLLLRILWAISQPYRHRESDTFEPPTEDQRTELERLCEIADLQVQGVWVSAELKRFMPAVISGDFPYNRHLIADKTFFTDYPAREREAIIMYETYLTNRYYYVLTAMSVSLPLLSFIILTAQLRRHGLEPLGPWLFTLGCVCSVALVVWVARQLVYRAIDRAVAQTDIETVENVIEKAAEREGKERDDLEVNAGDVLIYPMPSQRLKHLHSSS